MPPDTVLHMCPNTVRPLLCEYFARGDTRVLNLRPDHLQVHGTSSNLRFRALGLEFLVWGFKGFKESGFRGLGFFRVV